MHTYLIHLPSPLLSSYHEAFLSLQFINFIIRVILCVVNISICMLETLFLSFMLTHSYDHREIEVQTSLFPHSNHFDDPHSFIQTGEKNCAYQLVKRGF